MPRLCLATGCASGIGRELVSALLREDIDVVATDIDLEGLQRAMTERGWPSARVHVRQLDVSDAKAWDALVEEVERELGSIEALVNVAGYLRPGWVHEQTAEVCDRHIDVNLKGVVHGTRTVSARMVKRGRGGIVNVASMAALAPVQGIAVYCATKYAVRGLSLAVAQELAPLGIKVTVVCPDAVRTPMLELQRDYDEAAMTFSGSRELEPTEVTAAIITALRHGPLEIYLPMSRAVLARFGDLFPRSAAWLAPWLRRQGRKRQRRGV